LQSTPDSLRRKKPGKKGPTIGIKWDQEGGDMLGESEKGLEQDV
jgi:hypothetical protein